MKIQSTLLALVLASVAYASAIPKINAKVNCPAEMNSKSYCNCHSTMAKTKTVGDCIGSSKQLLRKSAHNAENAGYKHYLCCRPDDDHATCYGIALASACNWESGIAFLA
ncbi:hypothetical protein BGZ46_007998 [Entomortierella lignicola]|nr:hypothetical protein BGZ46_007998 [Entomortierella lignicola]